MKDWFNNPIVPKPVPDNPCVARYGPGPEGKTCDDCAHLFVVSYSKKYWKCELRKMTHGKGSDHKRSWPACAKFAQRTI